MTPKLAHNCLKTAAIILIILSVLMMNGSYRQYANGHADIWTLLLSVISIFLLIVGIGCFRQQPWSKKLILPASILALLGSALPGTFILILSAVGLYYQQDFFRDQTTPSHQTE